jgi:hypothetical protein
MAFISLIKLEVQMYVKQLLEIKLICLFLVINFCDPVCCGFENG